MFHQARLQNSFSANAWPWIRATGWEASVEGRSILAHRTPARSCSFRLQTVLSLIYFILAGSPASQNLHSAEQRRLQGLGESVEVHFDEYEIPHIFAHSWPDACRTLGYLHASGRLWQMDVYRRRASGRSAEIFGRSALASDVLVRRLGIRRGCDKLWNSDRIPPPLREQLLAYTEGVNAWIAENSPDNLPVMFRELGYQPMLWTPVDCLVFPKYMGWDQSGTDDDLWFGMMVEKLGVQAVEELWPLDRPYEVPAVKVQANRRNVSRVPLRPLPAASAAYERTLQQMAAADKINVPNLNLAYADVHGSIAVRCCGDLPLRLPGRGRIPMDGASGENDWTGYVPHDQLPLAVNPDEHFVATANGRPASHGYPHYLGWMWDPSYRVRRIHEMLRETDDLTVKKMQALQNDVHDKCAEQFVPVLLEALDRGSLPDELTRSAAGELRHWDYRAVSASVGPTIWIRWLRIYRDMVWQDEWQAREIEQPGGSWGYTGNNRREPMLEVLEYMTREHPRSIWFDDRATSARETRDDILRRSFIAAVEQLKRDFSGKLDNWRWGQRNRLRIGSMTGKDEFARDGGEVPGTSFTVNPGGGGGHVGGGASWRMIVDFGNTGGSVGVYPGGQSANPDSPHYDDQIPLWANGRYIPLSLTSQSDRLPKNAKWRAVVYHP